jgi:catechol-2,3-dioxygenase
MNIKIDHINLTVSKLEESRVWYQQLFGFESVERGRTAQDKRFEILAKSDFMICMCENNDLKRRDDDNNVHHRIFHFGIRVDDEKEWLSRIEVMKIKIKYGGPILYPFSLSWYIEDPDGHEIEVSYSNKLPLEFPK